jgi:hypothetical protein
MELYCPSLTLPVWVWAFLFFDPLKAASIRAFYSSRSDSYNESQGPTGDLETGKTLCCRAPPARSSKWCLQRYGYARSCRLPHCTQSTVWHCAVASLVTVAVSDEWSITLALCCSHTVATCLTELPTQSCWTTPYYSKPLWVCCRSTLCWPRPATRQPARLAGARCRPCHIVPWKIHAHSPTEIMMVEP